MKIEIVNGKASAYTPYNKAFIAAVKEIGGKWDSVRKSWVVLAERVEELKNLIRTVYGKDADVVKYSAGIRRPTLEMVRMASNLECANYGVLPNPAHNIRLRAAHAMGESLAYLYACSDDEDAEDVERMVSLYACVDWLLSGANAAWWEANGKAFDAIADDEEEMISWLEENILPAFKKHLEANGGWAQEL